MAQVKFDKQEQEPNSLDTTQAFDCGGVPCGEIYKNTHEDWKSYGVIRVYSYDITVWLHFGPAGEINETFLVEDYTTARAAGAAAKQRVRELLAG